MRLALLIGVVAWCATDSINASPYGEPEDDKFLGTVLDSVNTFSLNFFKTAAAEHENNLICAPIGVSTVLSMAYNGARGNTKEQLRKGLALPKDDAVTKAGFRSVINRLKNYPLVHLHLASGVFVDNGIELQCDFEEMTEEVFLSEVQSLDFENSRLASNVINKWSQDNTNGIIKNIVKPADVDSNTPLVLVSAVYFNGAWDFPFSVDNTEDRPFHINTKDTINIPTMYQNDQFDYGELPTIDASFVRLPYQSKNYEDQVSMFIIRPNTVDGLGKVIENFDTLSMDDLLKGSTTICDLYLPKFTITSELSLEETLKTMHMTDMFDNGLSDFTGITGSRSLTIGKIVQKAFIDVNEKGSEAAASTFMALTLHMFPSYIEFRVDRPFVAIIATIVPKPTILFAAAWDGRNK